jgi:hypothetical protein
MTESPLLDYYVGRYLKGPLRKEVEKRANRLDSEDILNEIIVPFYPRSLWLAARLNFVLQQDVGCIILCMAALEAALKAFLSSYFQRKLDVQFDSALDEMEVRSLIAACKTLGLVEESTVSKIDKLRGRRTKYVHSKTELIAKDERKRLEKKGEWQEPIGELLVAANAGEGESYQVLRLLEKVLMALFQNPRWW